MLVNFDLYDITNYVALKQETLSDPWKNQWSLFLRSILCGARETDSCKRCSRKWADMHAHVQGGIRGVGASGASLPPRSTGSFPTAPGLRAQRTRALHGSHSSIIPHSSPSTAPSSTMLSPFPDPVLGASHRGLCFLISSGRSACRNLREGQIPCSVCADSAPYAALRQEAVISQSKLSPSRLARKRLLQNQTVSEAP